MDYVPIPPYGDLKEIKEHFGCAYKTVKQAIRWQTNSPLAAEIRKYIREKYQDDRFLLLSHRPRNNAKKRRR